MGRITAEVRLRKEQAIRAAMDQLLSGELLPNQRFSLKALAQEAGVNRTGFYPKRAADGSVLPGPYQHLAREFQSRLTALMPARAIADMSELERLIHEVEQLKTRISRQEAAITRLIVQERAASRQLSTKQVEIENSRSIS
ncbi:hypothetical protein AB0M86_47990 [Streptomyces sp. NPDC051639]|uniref:hypothetical protein n=1 Tax=Streptomyces sp. NPDC051639 TaxID=3155671 RepID=UPI0034125913